MCVGRNAWHRIRRFLKSVTPIRRFSFSVFRVKSTKIETEKIDKIPLENGADQRAEQNRKQNRKQNRNKIGTKLETKLETKKN